MKLHVYARDGHLMPHPGMKYAGQVNPYIGRSTIVLEDGSIAHPAVKEGELIELDSASGQRVVAKMRKQAHDPPLWAGNEETARECGVPFVPIAFGPDGEFELTTPTTGSVEPTSYTPRGERVLLSVKGEAKTT